MSVITKDLGAATAYAYAVEKGYTGTEAEFAELMADYANVGQRAENAADSALESKSAAQTAAQTATNKASEATQAAQTATTKAAEAQADADAAALDARQAMFAASTATSKATEATTAAATAVSSKDAAVSANTAAQSAKTAAQTAQQGAETARDAVQASAAQIATNASDITQLKEDLNVVTGLTPIRMTTGAYIGQSRDVVNPTPVNNGSWMYAILSCSAGQKVTVNGVSGGTPRAWVFADSLYNVLDSSNTFTTYTRKEVTAPSNTAYLIINNQISDGRSSYLGWAVFGYAEDTNTLLAFKDSATSDMIDLEVSASESALILRTGKSYIDADWAQGVANTSGGVTAQTYSYATNEILSYDRDITITIASGFQAFVRYYEGGIYDSTGSWTTSPINIPANQQFMITVNRYPTDQSDIADASFITKLTIQSALDYRLNTLENSGTLNTQWNGKQWFAFGCSLSDNATAMPFPSYTGEVTGKYPSYLCALSGLIHTNYAKGGSTISDAEHTNADGRHPTAIQKLQEAITAGTIVNADLITLEGCVNDWSHATPLGDFTDTTDATICGSMYLFLTTAMNANPDATIIVIGDSTGKSYTRPDSTTVNLSYDRKNTIQLYQSQYIHKMKEYCEFMGVIFIDAGQDSEINSLHPQYLGDMIHHSDEGGEQFANAIWSKLKNIQPNVT